MTFQHDSGVYPHFKRMSNLPAESKKPQPNQPTETVDPQMEVDQRGVENDEWRNLIAGNLRKSVKKRGSRKEFSKTVTEYYESSHESVKDVLEGKRSLRAEEILFLEGYLGIHRDEILGKLNETRVHRKMLKELEQTILTARRDAKKDANELESKLKMLLTGINAAITKETSYKEKEQICEYLFAHLPLISGNISTQK